MQSCILFVCLQLQMLGYDVSWAAFNVIEVMSSTKFTHKVCSFVGVYRQKLVKDYNTNWLHLCELKLYRHQIRNCFAANRILGCLSKFSRRH